MAESIPSEVAFEEDWHHIVLAAESAGRHSARELARHCSSWELGRTGRVWVRVRPPGSSLATWLCETGRGTVDGSGVFVDVVPSARELLPAMATVVKARSLLVRRACAAACCAVLVQEAGAVADVLDLPDHHFLHLCEAEADTHRS